MKKTTKKLLFFEGFWAQAALGAFLAAGVYGALLGYGSDRDSLRVICSARVILAGGYLRSRSFGFPLHEAASALLFGLGGLVAVNLGSVAVTAGGIMAARRLVPATRRGSVVVVLALCPLLLADGSSAIDFGWDFAAGMALCVVAIAFLDGGGSAAAYFTAALVLLLLRPDNVLFLAAVSLALLMAGVVRWRVVVAATTAAGVLAACIYLALNGAGMLATGVTTTRPLAARLLRAGLFLSAALGPGGVLALALLARGPRVADRGMRDEFLRRVVWLAWVLYVPRFIALPDQLDYLILPVTFSLVAACAQLRPRAVVAVCVLACVPSFVTFSLISRNDASGAVQVAPQLQWGALPQDWAARRFATRMQDETMTRLVQSRANRPALRYDDFLPGYVSPSGDLVIGQMHLYRVLALGGGVGAGATVPRARFRAVIACGAALGPNLGWRAWEAPMHAPQTAFNCWLASPPP